LWRSATKLESASTSTVSRSSPGYNGFGGATFLSITIFLQHAGEFDRQPLVIVPPRSPRSLAAADFDLDGDLDLALACAFPGNTLVLYTQTSPGRFVATQDIPADGPVFVRAADWNSDGETDLAAALQRPVGPSGTFSDLIAIFFNGR
jgi:hypothetical protein